MVNINIGDVVERVAPLTGFKMQGTVVKIEGNSLVMRVKKPIASAVEKKLVTAPITEDINKVRKLEPEELI